MSTFWQELAYSKSFLSIVERAASNPNSAAATFRKEWAEPMIATASKSNDFAELLVKGLRETGWEAAAQNLEQV